jgi:hypothetical protein
MANNKEKLILNDSLEQIGFVKDISRGERMPVEVSATYKNVYSDYPDPYKTIFSIFHQKLNQLFEFMNRKMNSNKHYNAAQSRELLDIMAKIENLSSSLKGLGINISLKNDYQSILSQCKTFLASSNGSTIPETFKKITLIKYDPIFSITRDNFQDMPADISETIRLISTRNADFDNMELDEKLAILNNLIENLLKRGDKYISLDYEKVFFGFLSENDIKDYRKQTHCFRHGAKEALENRKNFSKEQKELLSDIGIFIAIYIHKFLRK